MTDKQYHRQRGKAEIQRQAHVAPTRTAFVRQQIDLTARTAGLGAPCIDTVERGGAGRQRADFLIELRARQQHELDIEIAAARIASDHVAVEIDLVGLERRLPIHLERKHLAQVFLCGRRQREIALQHALGRNAQHGAHAGIVDRVTQALELRALRIVRLAARDARVLARLIGALAPDDDLVGTQIDQQRFGTLLDQRCASAAAGTRPAGCPTSGKSPAAASWPDAS